MKETKKQGPLYGYINWGHTQNRWHQPKKVVKKDKQTPGPKAKANATTTLAKRKSLDLASDNEDASSLAPSSGLASQWGALVPVSASASASTTASTAASGLKKKVKGANKTSSVQRWLPCAVCGRKPEAPWDRILGLCLCQCC